MRKLHPGSDHHRHQHVHGHDDGKHGGDEKHHQHTGAFPHARLFREKIHVAPGNVTSLSADQAKETLGTSRTAASSICSGWACVKLKLLATNEPGNISQRLL